MSRFYSCSKAPKNTRLMTEIVPREFRWNLNDIFVSDAEWEMEKRSVAVRFKTILQFKGQLSKSGRILSDCLIFNSEIQKTLQKLNAYAAMISDEDTRVAKYMAMRQETGQLLTEYKTISSFIGPEINEIHLSTIKNFIKDEPRLQNYLIFLMDIKRRKEHILSEEQEQIVAAAGLMSDEPQSIYTIFSNAEMPYPEVTLRNGKKVRMDKASYAKYRSHPDRSNRKKIFNVFFGCFDSFRGTFGAQLYAHVKRDLFYSRVRGYSNTLNSALDSGNIPEAVYTGLIENIKANLPTFHRYLTIRRHILGITHLYYSDLYAPVFPKVQKKYTFRESKELILGALEPLGKPYTDIVERAFGQNWIDVFPSKGKRSGAYCNDGGYGIHPFILLNFNGLFQDVSTLVHEIGHAVHTCLSNQHQPYPTSEYSIFVAEVASTFNEDLLFHFMLQRMKNVKKRLSFLMEYLDHVRSTFFRQTLFAEFEYIIHRKVEQGEALTGDVLNEIYRDLLSAYYGEAKGICVINDKAAVEWAYVPHFYYSYYVYQYATSFTASTALADSVLTEEHGARDRYITFLSSGGCNYPIEMLSRAGVDLTGAGPFQRTIRKINRIMDEIEELLEIR